MSSPPPAHKAIGPKDHPPKSAGKQLPSAMDRPSTAGMKTESSAAKRHSTAPRKSSMSVPGSDNVVPGPSTGERQGRISKGENVRLRRKVSISVDPPPQSKQEDIGVRLFTLTWNVGGAKPAEDMKILLSLTTSPVPDMYGIGLQEVKPNGNDGKEWVDAMTAQLADYDYVMVRYRQIQGMVLVVFVKRILLPHCTSFESEVTKTGFGGWWGNKGGVSIRMDIFGINLIIVNCHLAAHQKKVAERILDFDSILDDQKFRDIDVDNILDHDYVFWVGDLNFRVDNMTRQEIDEAISKKEYHKMMEYDQLNRCREQKLILEDFQEMEITFDPSYKFDTGTSRYDSSPKKRLPAWCDRILWHVYNMSYDNCKLKVIPIEYTSYTEYVDSDHKPVSATFFFTVYPKPPRSPVQFTPQQDWKSGESQSIAYTASRHVITSGSDFIGLYKADFNTFDKYYSYVYAIEGAENAPSGVVVTFSSRATVMKPGSYCLCYLTRKYSLMGISNTFQIE